MLFRPLRLKLLLPKRWRMPRKPMMPQTRTLLLAWTALQSAATLAPSTVLREEPVPACVC